MTSHIAKVDPFDSPHDGTDAIGFSASASFNPAMYAGAASKAAPSNKGKERGKKIAEGIRGVTRSPYTAAAIAATAAVAPPAGTVAAGVMTAGVGVAEGIAALAAPVGSVLNKVKLPKVKIRIGKKKKKSKGKPLSEMSDSELRSKISTYETLTEAMPHMRSMHQAMIKRYRGELSKRAKAKREGKPSGSPSALFARIKDTAERASAAARHEQAVEMLAEIMVRAEAGDEQAQDEVVTLMLINDPEMLKAKGYAKALADGYETKEAKKLARYEADLTDKQWKVIIKRAKARAEGMKIPKVKRKSRRKPPNKDKVKAVARDAAKNLVNEANRQVRARGPMTGLLVQGSQGKIKKGRFKNLAEDLGIDGAVVLKDGRVVTGDWKGV